MALFKGTASVIEQAPERAWDSVNGTQQPEFTLATKPRLNNFRLDTLTIQAARALLQGIQRKHFIRRAKRNFAAHLLAQTFATSSSVELATKRKRHCRRDVKQYLVFRGERFGKGFVSLGGYASNL